MSLRKRSIYQYVLSILAAAFGVQSEASRERDFTWGHPAVFIAGGIGFVAIFVVILLIIVQAIVASA